MADFDETDITNPEFALQPGDNVFGMIGGNGNFMDSFGLSTVVGQQYSVAVFIDDENGDYSLQSESGSASTLNSGSDGESGGYILITTFMASETTSFATLMGLDVSEDEPYTLSFSISAVIINPTDGDDNFFGTGLNDIVSLLEGDDEYNAGLGNDNVSGDAGGDYILLGAGNDVGYGGSGDDLIEGQNGSDMLWGDDGDDALEGGNGNDTVDGGLGNDYIDGGNGHDRLIGGVGNDILNGGDGADKLSAGSGNDLLYGGNGNDGLGGNFGDDDIYGGNGNDAVRGGAGSDIIYGGNGRDNLFGDDGNDVIIGGAGRDKLAGGAGSDIFVFEQGDGADYIRDFDVTEDQLDINLFFFEGNLPDEVIFFPIDDDFLFNYPYQEFASQVGNNTVFNFGNGDSLTLANTTAADLTFENFTGYDYFIVPENLG